MAAEQSCCKVTLRPGPCAELPEPSPAASTPGRQSIGTLTRTGGFPVLWPQGGFRACRGQCKRWGLAAGTLIALPRQTRSAAMPAAGAGLPGGLRGPGGGEALGSAGGILVPRSSALAPAAPPGSGGCSGGAERSARQAQKHRGPRRRHRDRRRLGLRAVLRPSALCP